MKLPNADQAVIEREKLCDYLLSTAHIEGRHKAAFFASLGYTVSEWNRFQEDIRKFHLEKDVAVETRSYYGVKYEIRGPITGPSGKTAEVVTVWIIESGNDVPRLVTAYPGEKS